jgi:hypothetical protein
LDSKGILSDNLTSENLDSIVILLKDEDFTIRLLASSFLHNLGDPRINKKILFLLNNSVIDSELLKLSSSSIRGTYNQLPEAEISILEKRINVLYNSKNPLQLEISNNPVKVVKGQQTMIKILVRSNNDAPMEGANVKLSSGGGKFMNDGNTGYDPNSRLHGPYSAEGVTNKSGEFVTWWVCNPCAKGYGLIVEASKEGHLNAKENFEIDIN